MRLAGHLDGHIWGVEDMSAASVTSVEVAGIAAIQSSHCCLEHLFAKGRHEVVVRRHEAEAMTHHELFRHELRNDPYTRAVVPVVAEDVLLGDRASGDVEGSGVTRTYSPSVPESTAAFATTLQLLDLVRAGRVRRPADCLRWRESGSEPDRT